eukprot:11159414-Lingulodinium_polyedra.AAC.1
MPLEAADRTPRRDARPLQDGNVLGRRPDLRAMKEPRLHEACDDPELGGVLDGGRAEDLPT